MARAIWNGAVLAESDEYEVVEGNVYFPPSAINRAYFQESDKQTICGWKGTAHYYHIVVNGEVNVDVAWYYPAPKEEARMIDGHVAFWCGVTVER